MPITIADDLPAISILKTEGVPIKRQTDATRQDIRPLEIALLNLMPTKEATEIQFARLLGTTPLQIHLTLLTTGSYTPKNTPTSHLQKFYKTFNDIKKQKFDGLIITGAPVETMPFTDVAYWPELSEIFAWSRTHIHSNFAICWGAQAAAYYFRQIPKYPLPNKKFGVFQQRVFQPAHPLMLGFNDVFPCPVSRHTENRVADFPFGDNCIYLAGSEDSGLCLVDDTQYKTIYAFNHIEYDTHTLHGEYARDRERGQEIPYNYYPCNDFSQTPKNTWRAHAHLLFANWINMVYQSTPYSLDAIGSL